MTKLLFAGEGWGGKAAFRSLTRDRKYAVSVITKDPQWKTELQAANHPCVEDFNAKYDLVICAGWRGIIREQVIAAHRIINIHYSLLPRYRGFHSTVWAMLNDERQLGFSIHRINAGVDDGPLIYQYQLENDMKQTAAWYMAHFNEKVEAVLSDVVEGYLSGLIPEIEQDRKKASWVGKRSMEDCCIDFNRDIAYQKAFFRALTAPYPLPFFRLKMDIFEVGRADFHPSEVVTHTGRILNIDDNGVWISCKGGYLICKTIFKKSTNEELAYQCFKRGEFVNANR